MKKIISQLEKDLLNLQNMLEINEDDLALTEKKLLQCFYILNAKDPKSYKKEEIKTDELKSFLVDIEKTFPKNAEVVPFVEYLSKTILQFNKLKIFPKHNELISCFILTELLKRADYPAFSFDTTTDCPFDFSQALQSQSRLCWYIAEALKSQIKDPLGKVLFLVEHYEFSSTYASSPGETAETIFEWHELNAAIQDWKKASLN